MMVSRQALLLIYLLNRRRNRQSRRRRLTKFRLEQRKQFLVFMVLMGFVVGRYYCNAERETWMKERSSDWWERIVPQFTSDEWRENFRVSPETFGYICRELQPYLLKQDTHIRKAVSVKRRVAITLWRLSTNAEYRTIAHLFGVAKSTAREIVEEVCNAIVRKLFKKYIAIPSREALVSIIQGFADDWGFPQCVGALDGSHIPILVPQDFPKDYFNRKGHHSILLQGLVYHKYRFMDINVGWPGSVHDARVLANSKLYQKGERGELFPYIAKEMSGVSVPLVVLGDPAYPLLQWIMKPYSDNGRLTRQQSVFNYRLSRARVVAENAFGRLKGRWRCLLKRNDCHISRMPTIVTVCAILHNICEVHGDEFNHEWIQDGENTAVHPRAADEDRVGQRAEEIRNAIAQFFNE